MEKLLFDFLKTHNIPYKLFKHQPVFTCAEKLVLIDSNGIETLPGAHTKNLFLKDHKNNKFYLISMLQDKKLDLKTLGTMLNNARLSMGKPEELLTYLKLTPGAVSPFGLIFDTHNNVTLILDKDLLNDKSINFHPLRNDMNVNLAINDFVVCMENMNHKPQIISIPIKL